MSLVALALVLVLCWLAMVFMGPRMHSFFDQLRGVEVPDDASALSDPSMRVDAPCDTCDGVGAGQVDGELMTCPICRGTGIVSSI